MRSTLRFMALALVLIVLVLVPAPAAFAQTDPGGIPSGDGVDPIYVDGNPSCATLNSDNAAFPSVTSNFGFKISNSPNGTFTLTNPPGELTGSAPSDPSNSVTISNSDGTYFDWAATLGIDAVIVKGGPNANAYVYVPEDASDTHLHPPINNTAPYGISHIEFCYDYNLTATKAANGQFKRNYTWTIDKTVAPASHTGVAGQSFDSDYNIVVDQSFTDSEFAVAGSITVNNPTPFTVSFSVSDSVNGTTATVNCPTYSLTPGGSTTCTYSAGLGNTNPGPGTNSATITSNTAGVAGATAAAAYGFGDPTSTNGLGTINVSDTFPYPGGTPEPLGSASGDFEFDNDQTFTCSTNPADYTNGSYTYSQTNRAQIDETGDSDEAVVTVTCTLPALSAQKTAVGTYDRIVTWKLTKSVDDAEHSGNVGTDAGSSTWTVVADKTETLANYKVVGTITVNNPAAIPQTFTVSDVLNDGTEATVACPTYTVPAGGSVFCTYTATPSGATAKLNTATITAPGNPAQTATAPVSFAENLVGVDVGTLSDERFKYSDAIAGDTTKTFPETFPCPADVSLYDENGLYVRTETNTAILNGNIGLEASASVKVTCYAPVVSKTAQTSLMRTWDWTIDKSSSTTSLELSAGQKFGVSYNVVVNATPTDSAWAVAGTITVKNPNPAAAMDVTLADVVSDGIVVALGCSPLHVDAGSTATCDYSKSLPDAGARTNTATATLNGASFSSTAAVNFANATVTKVDDCADVSDDHYGTLGKICFTDLPKTFTYVLEVGPYDRCGEYMFTNTASFTTDDTGATGSDSHTVNITVPCAGCTLTQGYWKTHSDRGPAPYDDAWKNIGSSEEDTLFFLSGQTWYQVFWTAPAGNAYYNLAHQYMAAKLSILNGASTTPEVNAAITYAETFFGSYTPSSTLPKSVRAKVLAAASTLDQFNNGLIGPGHCSEDVRSASFAGILLGPGLYLPAITK